MKFDLKERGIPPALHDSILSEAVNSLLNTSREIKPNESIRMKIERSKRFVRGDQYVTLDKSNTSSLKLVPIRDRKVLAHSMNFLKSDGKKLTAVVNQHMPGVKVTPIDPENADHVRDAQVANQILKHWMTKERFKQEAIRLINCFWKSGNTYTNIGIAKTGRTVKLDTLQLKALMGETDEQPTDPGIIYQPQQQPGQPPSQDGQGGMPQPITGQPGEVTDPVTQNTQNQDSGGMPTPISPTEAPDSLQDTPSQNPWHTQGLTYTKETPEPGEPVDINVPEYRPFAYTTTGEEVTIPDGIRDFEVNPCPWLRFDKVIHIGELISIYGSDVFHLVPNRGDEDTGINKTALGVPALPNVSMQMDYSNTINQMRQNGYAVRTLIWFDPMNYELLRPEHGAPFKEAYPNGVVLHVIGQRLVRMSPGVIKEDWVLGKPDPFEDAVQESLATDVIPAQIIINDSINMALRHLFNGIPKTVVDSKLLAPEQMKSMQNNPFDIVRANVSGMDMGRAVTSIPTATFPKDLPGFQQEVREMSREIDGVLPQIFGGGPPVPTYREASMRRDSAMSQLSLIIEALRDWMHQVCTLVLRKMAIYGIEDVELAQSNYKVHEDLSLEGWQVEVEEGIPVSDSEARDALVNLFQMGNPELFQALDLFAPQNKGRIYQLLGIAGMRSSSQDDDQYCNEVLKGLLHGDPTVFPPAAPGMPPQVFAPIQPNPDLEDPQIMIGFMKSWAKRVDGGIAIKAMNPKGYGNVLMYISEYQSLLQMQQQQAAMAAAGGPPPGPPGQDANAPGPNGSGPLSQKQQQNTGGAPPQEVLDTAPQGMVQ